MPTFPAPPHMSLRLQTFNPLFLMALAKQEKPSVEIKGYGGKLGLFIDSFSPLTQVEEELRRILQNPKTKQFFQGATIFLQTEDRQITPDEFDRLQFLLKQEGNLLLKSMPTPEVVRMQPPQLSVVASSMGNGTAPSSAVENGTTPSTAVQKEPLVETDQTLETKSQSEIHDLPIPTRPEPESPVTPVVSKETKEESSDGLAASFKGLNVADALLVHQTLRSGQKIRTEKSVVVIGDLNAGAEIYTEQNIIVLGTIRGMVHAGTSGNRKAFIFALRMRPTQIRIAELITQPPVEDKKNPIRDPEIAFIEEGMIVSEPCHSKIRV